MSRSTVCVVHVYFPSEVDYFKAKVRARDLGKSTSRYIQDLVLRDIAISEVVRPGSLPVEVAPDLSNKITAREAFINQQFGVKDGEALIIGRPPEKEFSINDLIDTPPPLDTPQFAEQGKASKDILDHMRDQQEIKESMPDEIDLDDLE